MIFQGKLEHIEKDILGGGYRITFNTSELPSEIPDREKILNVTAKEYRHKRSLDANAYCWLLVSQIASALTRTKDDVYEEMIFRYGHLIGEESDSAIMVKADTDIRSHFHGEHLYPRYHSSVMLRNKKMDIYLIYRGSSSYDTAEMSSFLEGVVSDAKELGIDTVPRVELEKIKEKWRI